MTHEPSVALPGASFWVRAVVLVLARPSPLARPRCARRRGSPAAGGGGARRSCPLPDPDYLRFRLETQYGADGRPDPHDLVTYLEWCRDMGKPGPGRRSDAAR